MTTDRIESLKKLCEERKAWAKYDGANETVVSLISLLEMAEAALKNSYYVKDLGLGPENDCQEAMALQAISDYRSKP